VHDEVVEVARGVVDDLLGRVREGDRDARAGARHQAGGGLELLDPPLVAAYLAVVDLVGEGGDVAVEVLDPLLEGSVVPGLAVDEGGQVGVAAGTEVGSLAVVGADDEQCAAQQDHQRGAHAPRAPRPARPAGLLRLLVGGPRVGSRGHGD